MSDRRPPLVVAIVLNYNGLEVTLPALESLLASSYGNLDLLHVDNGSTDGSYETVARELPGTLQVRLEVNDGVVPGINRGLEVARGRDADYVLLLNNDIEVAEDFVAELVRTAQEHDDVGCVGPKIYYHSDPERLWSTGGILRFRESITRERGIDELDRGQYDMEEEVPYVNGCAMLVPRAVLEEIGPWDPLFKFAVDDAEWCTRMKLRGYRCWYSPKALLWHKVGTTVGGYKASRTYYNGRSAALFVRRYGRLTDWANFLLFMGAALPIAFLRELPHGNQGAVVAKARGVVDGLRTRMTDPPAWPAPEDSA